MRKIIIALFVTVFAASAFAQEKENILYILDGKIVSKAEFTNIDPACVKSMKVVKGFDKAMVITTGVASSASTRDESDFAIIGINSKDTSGCSKITLRSREKLSPKQLYVMKDSDGKIFTPSGLQTITPEQIKSMVIIRGGDKALEKFKQYGDVSNGVIYIELK